VAHQNPALRQMIEVVEVLEAPGRALVGFQVLQAAQRDRHIVQFSHRPCRPVAARAQPVILSSGYDHDEARGRFGEGTPAGFIQKPYLPEQLMAEIGRCLGRGQPGSAS